MAVPSISMVVPTYNVATYLPAFLTSLDEQTADLDGVEFVFVDDGATDDSAKIIDSWLQHRRRRDIDARLLHKQNGGLSSARNAGLDVATGEWVTFCDPDDLLGADYLKVMLDFVRSPQAATAHVIAGRFLFLDDETGTVRNGHPLRHRFAAGTRIIDMTREPQFLHVAANHGLFRRAVLDEHGLRYDPRVRPVWEDGHVTARYLAKFDEPRLAVMADAHYLYRRRSDGSSLMQGAWMDRGKYVDVIKYGWLDALRTVAAERGSTPLWLQNMILYDLFGYFQRERQSPSPTGAVSAELAAEFYELVEEVLSYIDASSIEGFRTTWVAPEIKRALVIGFKGREQRPSELVADRLDDARGLVRLYYCYAGELPHERFAVRGQPIEPAFAKIRRSEFFGRILMHERVVWLPADATVSAELDGRAVPIRAGDSGDAARVAELLELSSDDEFEEVEKRQRMPFPPGVLAKAARLRRAAQWRLRRAKKRVSKRRRAALVARQLARTPWKARRYEHAWLLIDRDSQAQDNAEHLYRYLREHRPSINSWFVLARDSGDWPRLEREGCRLIEHGSREHKIALLHCDHLISSQIDQYIVKPMAGYYGEGHWKYTFLQHGVTKDDLSIWINPKPISLMITATPDEQESIVSADSPYIFSEHEIRMTGFPRHDRLLALAKSSTVPPRTMLIMPTWRRGLVLDSVTGGNDRELRHDFWDTEYAVQWRSVLESERLHEIADAHGWHIAFIPHPNMQGYLDNSPLPEHVTVHRFRDIDIQQMLVSGGALVSDYSSLAFEMAYLQRPVVYFQFDRDQFFSGGHAYRRGTWDYEKDGFGPVTLDASDAIDAIAEVMQRDGVPEPMYAERMAGTFPFRDGECSRRTYEAVEELTRPLPHDELYRRGEPAEVPEG